MVGEKVGDVYDRGMSGEGPQYSNQIGSEPAPAPGPGQTDYSKQWAEYYRSVSTTPELGYDMLDQDHLSFTLNNFYFYFYNYLEKVLQHFDLLCRQHLSHVLYFISSTSSSSSCCTSSGPWAC